MRVPYDGQDRFSLEIHPPALPQAAGRPHARQRAHLNWALFQLRAPPGPALLLSAQQPTPVWSESPIHHSTQPCFLLYTFLAFWFLFFQSIVSLLVFLPHGSVQLWQLFLATTFSFRYCSSRGRSVLGGWCWPLVTPPFPKVVSCEYGNKPPYLVTALLGNCTVPALNDTHSIPVFDRHHSICKCVCIYTKSAVALCSVIKNLEMNDDGEMW